MSATLTTIGTGGSLRCYIQLANGETIYNATSITVTTPTQIKLVTNSLSAIVYVNDAIVAQNSYGAAEYELSISADITKIDIEFDYDGPNAIIRASTSTSGGGGSGSSSNIVRINGTNYSITGGKTRINGTNYSIAGGRARISGTNYDISFVNTCNVTITGDGDRTVCYVIINNQAIYRPTTITLNKNDIITLYTYNRMSNGIIKIDNETVASGYGVVEYEYTVSKDCIIELKNNGNTSGRITVTTT